MGIRFAGCIHLHVPEGSSFFDTRYRDEALESHVLRDVTGSTVLILGSSNPTPHCIKFLEECLEKTVLNEAFTSACIERHRSATGVQNVSPQLMNSKHETSL
ncbi:hypothetical protein TNCV_1786021 [Trichonephila clavipes]|nr:hypothetical protein TNCV_1786021 [Trichonephila clavipes]